MNISFKKLTIVFLGVFVILTLFCSYKIIPTGYTGVRTTFGLIDSRTVPNGFNWKIPYVQSIELVNNKQQDILFKSKIWSETSARTAIFYENITVTYQINPERSAWIYANVSDYRSTLVSESIVSSVIKASSKNLTDADATNRGIIEPIIMKNLQDSLNEKYGADCVIINKVTINNADFEDSYNTAIAERQKAVLEAERQQIENQRMVEKAEADAIVRKTEANATAEAEKIDAQAKADIKKIEAEAEAQAILLKAEAEAEANEKISKSLTEYLLVEEFARAWDGKTPDYIGDMASIFKLFVNKD